MFLAAAAPVHRVPTQSTTTIGPFSVETLVIIALALVMWVVVYLLYKFVMTKRKDFGLPVRRRILCRKLRVDRDQSAEVPFWWTDLQIQIAVGSHWKQTLRAPLVAAEPHAHAQL
ncbi:MAG: hypothetical protein JOZ46_02760 [Candidatus Dormibacteraeota bacterium]|nr:hypothetical protein [Candidatus Dormibacteraeota bacterium]MBV9524720.1 hypothetical protein [Candidatus Dormibacteraeota bacterium]